MERRSPWEMGLLAALGVALVAMLVYALLLRTDLQVNVRAPGSIFFAALTLLLLLAWLAQDRARRAHIAQFQMITEVLHRHLGTEQALRDALTGVYNRAALDELSERYLRRADRSDLPLTLVVLDLDYFHELNSTYGHIAGDLALAEFAHTLQSSTRGSDVLARYGGDEFVLLLAETPRAGAEVVIRRVQDRVRTRNAQLSEGQIPLNFTVGVAGFQKGMDFTELFRQADLDLLQRKAQRQGTPQATARI